MNCELVPDMSHLREPFITFADGKVSVELVLIPISN